MIERRSDQVNFVISRKKYRVLILQRQRDTLLLVLSSTLRKFFTEYKYKYKYTKEISMNISWVQNVKAYTIIPITVDGKKEDGFYESICQYFLAADLGRTDD